MTVERYDSIHSAEAVIRAVEGNGSASQTFGVLMAVEMGFWRRLVYEALRHPRFAVACAFALRRPFRVYAVRDGHGVVLCAPLHFGADGEWTVVADDIVELGFTDFVYARRDFLEQVVAFRAVMRRMAEDGIKRITWQHLETGGVTASLLVDWAHETVETSRSVRITFPDGVGQYARKLGRNARSNERKARNRIRRDGCDMTFAFYSSAGIGGDIYDSEARSLLRRCRAVYVMRQKNRYGHSGLLARLFFLHGSYVPISIPGERSFVAALKIDGKVAAYMEGYVNVARAALEVPRIAMDDGFGRYSPGRLLVAETIKWLCENSDIRTIDLCRGDERYKTDLGGDVYDTATVCVETEASA